MKIATIKTWMDKNCVNCPCFAKMLENEGYEASRFTVQSWRNGKTPKRAAWPYIERATKGKVKPSSFL